MIYAKAIDLKCLVEQYTLIASGHRLGPKAGIGKTYSVIR